MLIAFNKPYGVLSQFTADASAYRPLSEFGFPKDVYPIGRLDADSEGLLLLSVPDNLDLSITAVQKQGFKKNSTATITPYGLAIWSILFFL